MKINVLLVEDNPGDRRLVEEALKEAGDGRFSLDWADRLAPGLEKLSVRPPDAVILDLSLPDSDGLATFTRLHAQAPDVPVVVLTGLRDEAVGTEAVRQGAQDYLYKGELTGGLLLRSILYAIERLRARQAIKKERERLFAVLETMPAMVRLVTPDRRVTFANRALRTRFGDDCDRHCYEYTFGSGRPCEFCEADRVLKTGQPHHWEINSPDGAILDAYHFPFTDVDGSPLLLEMLMDITERKRAEEEIRRLSRGLVEAQEAERRRLARELHDSAAQGLAAISINLSVIQRSARLNEKAQKNLKTAIEMAAECTDEIRNISHLLHPMVLDEMGLFAGLQWFVNRFGRRTGIAVDLVASPELGRLPKETETALFRIVQEALTNIYRHSGSARAKVEALCTPSGVTLKIADEGRGMPSDGGKRHRRRPESGIGILSMRERARQLGAEFEIASSPKGTTVRVTLPRPAK
jgi:two-component system, NarL family, sensor histidine kinase UhpB